MNGQGRARIMLLLIRRRKHKHFKIKRSPFTHNAYKDSIFKNILTIFFFYNSFRKRATGIFNCSRYLATVRRAIL